MGQKYTGAAAFERGATRARRVLHFVALAALAILAPLALWAPVLETMEPTLDPSWVEAYGHFTRTGAQAGVDYVFTYGPLAHVVAPAFHPDTWTRDFLVGLALAPLVAFPLFAVAWRRRSLVATLSLLWIAVVLAPRSMGNEVGATCALLACVILLLEGGQRVAAFAVFAGALLAFFALVKFTLFALAIVAVGAVASRWWRDRDAWRIPIGLKASFCVAAVFFWLMAGQAPGGFFIYLWNALEVSRAYANGMHTPAPPGQIGFALALGALVLVQLWLIAADRRRNGVPMVLVVFCLLTLFLCWKMGVTRSQLPKFHVPAAAIAVLAAGHLTGPGLRAAGRVLFPIAAVALATLGVCAVYDVTPREHLGRYTDDLVVRTLWLARPEARRSELERIRNSLRAAYRLPAIQKRIDGRTVDMFSHNQSLVVFNDLNYHPRPVMQGYQACSRRLARMNGDFYASPDGPEFVLRLGSLSPIDGRYPTTEDPEALLMLFRNYRPVLMEKHFLLLERVRTGSDFRQVGEPHAAQETVGAWVALPDPNGAWQLLSFNLSRSLWGTLRGLAFQPPMPWLEVRLSDGAVRQGRLNEDTGRFLVNPVLDPVTSVETWPGASTSARVVAFRVVMPEGAGGLMDDYSYSITTVEPPLPQSSVE